MARSDLDLGADDRGFEHSSEMKTHAETLLPELCLLGHVWLVRRVGFTPTLEPT